MGTRTFHTAVVLAVLVLGHATAPAPGGYVTVAERDTKGMLYGPAEGLFDDLRPCRGDWVAVQALVAKKAVAGIIDELVLVGGEDILVYSLSNCRV